MHTVSRRTLLATFGAAVAASADPNRRQHDRIELRDIHGTAVHVSLRGKPSVLVFYSTVCPISNDYNERMAALYNDYTAKGVQLVFVNANQNESLREMAEHAKAAGFPFAVYKDQGNTVADLFGATVTPQAYVLDVSGELKYQGNIDDARNPARVQVNGLRMALDQVLAGNPVTKPESKAFGCTIKRVRKTS